jgi:hypothetical protein
LLNGLEVMGSKILVRIDV